jgi:tRNA1(Val) A37 N6-methylase TrmN6
MDDSGKFYLLLPYKRKEEIKNLIAQQKLVIEKLLLVRQSSSHSYFRIIIQVVICQMHPKKLNLKK